jgi:antitoxin HicB
MQKRNPHLGSSFNDFLKCEGIFEEVQAKALECAMKELIEDGTNAVTLSKTSV